MSQMNRAKSGLIFNDEFEGALSDGWIMSPSNLSLFDLTSRVGWLRMKHSVGEVTLLRNISPYPSVIDIKNDYNPTVTGDEGGLIVFNDQNTLFRVVEYFDNDLGIALIYPHLRLVRTSDRLFTAYSSNDGITWNIVGSVDFPIPNYWGLTVLNDDVSYQPMDIDWVRIYKSLDITIYNVITNEKVELYDATDVLVASGVCPNTQTAITLHVPNLTFPFTGYFKHYNAVDVLKFTSPIYNDIWGGDEYKAEYGLDVFKQNGAAWDRVNENSVFYLGELAGEQTTFLFQIENHETITFYNVNVQVAQFNTEFGYQWVDIAEYANGTPGIYSDTVMFAQLAPNDIKNFIIKITRDVSIPLSPYPFKFKIVIDSN